MNINERHVNDCNRDGNPIAPVSHLTVQRDIYTTGRLPDQKIGRLDSSVTQQRVQIMNRVDFGKRRSRATFGDCRGRTSASAEVAQAAIANGNWLPFGAGLRRY